MNIAGIATVIYGGLIEAGGVIGFLVAKSKPSLIAGAALGNLALIGGILLLLEIPEGRWAAIGAAGLVGLAFAVKLAKALVADAAGEKGGEDKDAAKKDGKAAGESAGKEGTDAKAAHDGKAGTAEKDAKAGNPKKAKGKVRAAALVLLSLAEIIIVLVYG
ncbi:MAG: TMEM14 family protein [Planctomycetes bacterium]|nr:TMEM14 family protein [Planctomycetota bacterium]